MPISTRIASRLCNSLPSIAPSRAFTTTVITAKQEWPQHHPLGPFYENLLRSPPLIPEVKPEDPPNSADPAVLPPGKKHLPSEADPNATKQDPKKPHSSSSSPTSKTFTSTVTPTEPTPLERARLVFGSRELGPAELAARAAEKRSASTYIAGVLVPPQPTEPDNCCMSGCVNCVWERYREDAEDWSAANSEAQRRLKEREASVDSDGGGSETNWVGDTKIAKNLWDEQVFEGVPIGIREFMKQEKRLKERHEREGTVSR